MPWTPHPPARPLEPTFTEQQVEARAQFEARRLDAAQPTGAKWTPRIWVQRWRDRLRLTRMR